ncbi:hypothetical protein AC1031_014125 [Aphanomyces cochlioides]|nr:hypothetical protein AC1031_014125 [Aphanomyces cochlioides]
MCELFAIPPTTFSRILINAEVALSLALKELREAAISWPSIETQAQWALATQAREPLVTGVFGFVDGKNLRVQEPSNADLQNAYYNGWLHCVFVTGVLCYGIDGTMIWGRHNCPGSWNDGEISRALQDKLNDTQQCGAGMKLASDSAFPANGRCAGKIITPIKAGDLDRLPPDCPYHLIVALACKQ